MNVEELQSLIGENLANDLCENRGVPAYHYPTYRAKHHLATKSTKPEPKSHTRNTA